MVDICLNESLSAFLSAKYVCLLLQLQLHLVEDVGRFFSAILHHQQMSAWQEISIIGNGIPNKYVYKYAYSHYRYVWGHKMILFGSINILFRSI